MELTKLADLVGVRAVSVGTGNLEQDGQFLESRLREEDSEPFSHQPGADVVVAVTVRAEWRLRVVRVQGAKAVEPDASVELGEERCHRLRVRDVGSGDVEVA